MRISIGCYREYPSFWFQKSYKICFYSSLSLILWSQYLFWPWIDIVTGLKWTHKKKDFFFFFLFIPIFLNTSNQYISQGKGASNYSRILNYGFENNLSVLLRLKSPDPLDKVPCCYKSKINLINLIWFMTRISFRFVQVSQFVSVWEMESSISQCERWSILQCERWSLWEVEYLTLWEMEYLTEWEMESGISQCERWSLASQPSDGRLELLSSSWLFLGVS